MTTACAWASRDTPGFVYVAERGFGAYRRDGNWYRTSFTFGDVEDYDRLPLAEAEMLLRDARTALMGERLH